MTGNMCPKCPKCPKCPNDQTSHRTQDRTTMTHRPYLKARTWTWKDASGNETPGIGLMQGTSVRAHLTVTEARTLADRLHDLADANGNPEPVLPTTHADQE